MGKSYKFFSFFDNESNENYSMNKFFKEFDSLELKYSPSYDSTFCGIREYSNNDLKHKLTLPMNVYAKASEFENLYNEFDSLTKQRYSYIEDNLQLVYGDDDVVHNDVTNYYNIEKKLIHNYLDIPQLDRIFDEDYFNFEWDMHVGQNFKEHRNDYNRDHFVHQIRNLYMMLILLGDYGFFNSIYELLQDSTCGKISEYTKIKLKQFTKDKYNSQYDLLKELQPEIKDAFLREADLFDKLTKGQFILDKGKLANETDKYIERCSGNNEDEYVKSYFLKYVIYASTMLCALFHDMGYPICHFLDIRQRVSDYNPTMYMFTNNNTETFDQLAAKLNDSLLFTIVSPDEIKRSLTVNSNGRYNHGAYSAIAFLLQFYNNGIVYSLTAEKQCAIELAAVAIYNHTAEYNCIEEKIRYENGKLKIKNGKKDINYYQAVFRQNPISFLLRICDDLQEWDRRYFEFSKGSDLSICKKCFVPILPKYEESGKDVNYFCACQNVKMYRHDSFLKRKLYVVRVSDDVSTDIIEMTTGTNLLKFSVNYDLYKLLKIARVNNTYAKFRLGDLNKLKKLIGDQNFLIQSNNNLNFKYIYLDYFITSNPILIKIKILDNYIVSKLGADYCFNNDKYKEILNSLDLSNIFREILKDDIKYKRINTIPLYCYLGNNKLSVFDFYRKLLEESLDYTYSDRKSLKNAANSFIEKFGYNDNEKVYVDTLRVLIEDCLYQYSKRITYKQLNDSVFTDIASHYYTQYEPLPEMEAEVYNAVGTFCCMNNDFNRYSYVSNSPIPNYYTDLFFFYKLNEQTKGDNTSKQ